MYNKFDFLNLSYTYNGEIINGEIIYYNTKETLKFYYSYYEDAVYPIENKPYLMKKLIDEEILKFDKGILKFNEEVLNLIEDKLRDTDSYEANHVA